MVTLAVYCYYRFRNSLDDVVELMALRNIHLSHQTVYNGAHRFGVSLAKQFRKNRHGKSGPKWHVDPPIFALKDGGAIYIEQLIRQGISLMFI